MHVCSTNACMYIHKKKAWPDAKIYMYVQMQVCSTNACMYIHKMLISIMYVQNVLSEWSRNSSKPFNTVLSECYYLTGLPGISVKSPSSGIAISSAIMEGVLLPVLQHLPQ